MELDLYKLELKDDMNKVISHYEIQLSRISVGRANPQILSSVNVIYYDTPTPINQISSISVPEPRQLLIRPFDISLTKEIVRAINSSSLGLNAANEGDKVRINIPDLTRQRRIELVKRMKLQNENARIGIRKIRQQVNKMIKTDDELNEDDEKYYLEEIQKITNDFIIKIEKLAASKEDILMKI